MLKILNESPCGTLVVSQYFVFTGGSNESADWRQDLRQWVIIVWMSKNIYCIPFCLHMLFFLNLMPESFDKSDSAFAELALPLTNSPLGNCIFSSQRWTCNMLSILNVEIWALRVKEYASKFFHKYHKSIPFYFP